jgi:capsular polysaccharide biosynthesis protein
MSEQVLDVRSAIGVLKRHRWTLAIAAVVGVAAGAGFVYLNPPQYTSQSMVLLPAVSTDSGQDTGASTQDAATQARIATSQAVLGPAARSLKPATSAARLRSAVSVSAATNNVMQISAAAATAGTAENIARQVAKSYLAYLTEAANSLNSAQRSALSSRTKTLQSNLTSVNDELRKTRARLAHEPANGVAGRADSAAAAQLTAQQSDLALQIDQIKNQIQNSQTSTGATLIDDATPAERPSPAVRYTLGSVSGMLIAAGLAALLLVLVVGRRSRRLRFRDEIADALGAVVIASVRSQAARSVAAWTTLLANYAPGMVDSWALRQTLRHLLGADVALGLPRPPGEAAKRNAVTVAVLSLGDDPRGLALGPQLASYAASVGVRTRLVATQGDTSTMSLWAACSGVYENSEVRENLVVGTQLGSQMAELTVVLAVIDRHEPELTKLPRTGNTFLSVSAGAATPEDLARAAVAADDAGARIDGILVADPDDLDRTSGRHLQAERLEQIPLPIHLTGAPATASPGATVSGLRSRRPR